MSEREFLAQVIQFARLLGWKVAHFRPARTAQGWRTPCQADAKGWPDLVLLRGRSLIFAELKVGRGRLSSEQEGWLAGLRGVGMPAFVWTPGDWGEIEAVLQEPCNAVQAEG